MTHKPNGFREGEIEARIDGLINAWADDLAKEANIDTLTRNTINSIAFLQPKPKQKPKNILSWLLALVAEHPMQTAAAAAMLIAMVIGIALADFSEQVQPPAAGNICEIENIESQNSTAIIANGTDSQPTVIWIFEE